MLFIQETKPELNTQPDSIKAKLTLFYTYWDFRIKFCSVKSVSDFTSTNQRGETSFSHVQKSFRPITNHGLSESCFRGLFRGHRG